MTAIHINRGTNRRFIAQVRPGGMHRWSTVYETRSYILAVKKMAERFAQHDYKRGRVLFESDYYDPIVVTEMSR